MCHDINTISMMIEDLHPNDKALNHGVGLPSVYPS